MSDKKKEKRRVHVVGSNTAVEGMFQRFGFDVIDEKGTPHLVCFTGGEDVTPFLYGERPISIDGRDVVNYNPNRDMKEMKAYRRYIEVPKVGICRGAQFLNVMNGGSMWQHVDEHLGDHKMKLITGFKKTGQERKPLWTELDVTSTHHQMMIPSAQAEILGVAGKSKVKYKESERRDIADPVKAEVDIEVLFYWNTSSLCYQPHPEYKNPEHPCQVQFFNLIKDWLQVKVE